MLRLIRDILYFQPERPATSIKACLEFLSRVQHRRAIVLPDSLRRREVGAARLEHDRLDVTFVQRP